MNIPLKVLIADDDFADRLLLKNTLEAFKSVEVIGEAESVAQMVEIVEKLRPDLILVDIEMPSILGGKSLGQLRDKYFPLIVVVASSENYAIQAFSFEAIDFLIKPVKVARLAETLRRAQERLTHLKHSQPANFNVPPQTSQDSINPSLFEFLPLKAKDQTILLPVNKITSIVANGQILTVTTIENLQFFLKYALKDLERSLDSTKFMRLSRSTIINIETIEKIFVLPGGLYKILLNNSQFHTSSRLQSRKIRNQFLKLPKPH